MNTPADVVAAAVALLNEPAAPTSSAPARAREWDG
jgi:hypothetical protein